MIFHWPWHNTATASPGPVQVPPSPAPLGHNNEPRDVNAATLSLIKAYEEFVPFVYDDLAPDRHFEWTDGKRYGYRPWDGSKPKGTLTIGYGHTNDALQPLKCRLGVTVTEPQACKILDEDLLECRLDVSRLVKVTLNDDQFGALVSFQFNTGHLAGSSALTVLNLGHYDQVPSHLAQWDRAGGKVLEGLIRRRDAEINLWNGKAPV